jgi:hypothetical protein
MQGDSQSEAYCRFADGHGATFPGTPPQNMRSTILMNCQQRGKNYPAARPGPPRAPHCMILSMK